MHRIMVILCTSYLIGVVIFLGVHDEFFSHELQHYFNEKIILEGLVVKDPDVGLVQTKIIVQPSTINTQKITSKNEYVLVRLTTSTTLHYGDHITLAGVFKKPESFITDTGREFDYAEYLAVNNVYGTVSSDSIKIISTHQGSFLLEKLFFIKRIFLQQVEKIFSTPESGLLAGMMIGEKSLLPKTLLDQFQIAGLSHIIVLSGYNITLVALLVMHAGGLCGLNFYNRRWAAILAALLFVSMTGFEPSSIRAGIMTTITFFLAISTRTTSVLSIILFTSTAMTLVNYKILLSPSFHLSFLAFFALAIVVPLVQKKILVPYHWFGLKKIIIETITIQLFVLPYIFWMSGKFSLLALVANLFVVPITPIIMIGGFLVVLTSFFLPGLLPFGVIIIKTLLQFCILVAEKVAAITSMITTVPPFSHWVVIGMYIIFFGISGYLYQKTTYSDIEQPL